LTQRAAPAPALPGRHNRVLHDPFLTVHTTRRCLQVMQTEPDSTPVMTRVMGIRCLQLCLYHSRSRSDVEYAADSAERAALLRWLDGLRRDAASLQARGTVTAMFHLARLEQRPGAWLPTGQADYIQLIDTLVANATRFAREFETRVRVCAAIDLCHQDSQDATPLGMRMPMCILLARAWPKPVPLEVVYRANASCWVTAYKASWRVLHCLGVSKIA
jgi:hypothetical protein